MIDGSLNFNFLIAINNELVKQEIYCNIKFYPSYKYDYNYSISSN